MVAKYQTWIWAFQIYEYFTEIAMNPKRGSYYLILGTGKKRLKKKKKKEDGILFQTGAQFFDLQAPL